MMKVEANGNINPDNPVMRGLLAALKKSPEQREATLQRIEENNYNLNPEAYVRNRKRMLQKEIDAIRAEIKLKDEKIAALKAQNEKVKAAIAAREVSNRVEKSQSLVDQMKASVAAIKASKPSVAPATPSPVPTVVEKDPAITALEAALAKMFPKRK